MMVPWTMPRIRRDTRSLPRRLSIDGVVEQRQVALATGQLQLDTNIPDLKRLQRELLTGDLAFFQRMHGRVMSEGSIGLPAWLTREGRFHRPLRNLHPGNEIGRPAEKSRFAAVQRDEATSDPERVFRTPHAALHDTPAARYVD